MSADNYLYPGTGILKNKPCLVDKFIFERFERLVTSGRVLQLEMGGVTGKFDIAHIKAIHKYIFGDVYTWAGEFRMIQIGKGGVWFAKPEDIEPELRKLCGHAALDVFSGVSEQDVAERLAKVMADLNRIHPFRDGNGRVQRVFIE